MTGVQTCALPISTKSNHPIAKGETAILIVVRVMF